MKQLPTVRSYGNYQGQNYGVHALRGHIGHLELFYSYDTIIAFSCHAVDDGRTVVCQNLYSTTTGKHLNAICADKKTRLPREEFLAKLQLALTAHEFEKEGQE